jgi:hypothetical protein
MKRFLAVFMVMAGFLCLGFATRTEASSPHFWRIDSPDHGQTFAYGSERNRAWIAQGRDQHLALVMDLTNDPFVDSVNPRQYDTFVFSFPGVNLGKDGKTFYYRDGDGHSVAVASRRPDFLGIKEIRLLPNASLVVSKLHGYLSLSLILGSDPLAAYSE